MSKPIECTMWEAENGTLFRTKEEADKYESHQLALEMLKAMYPNDEIKANIISEYFGRAYDAGWRVVRVETLQDRF